MKNRVVSTLNRMAARVRWREVISSSFAAPHGFPDSWADPDEEHESRGCTRNRRTSERFSTATDVRPSEAELLLKESDSLRYLLRRPIESQASAPALLCFLHDCTEAAPCDTVRALTRHGPFSGAGSRAAERFVIVAPQLPCASDAWCLYANAIQEIIEHEAQQHDCEPTRIYLTGFCIGANGVFDLAQMQPQLWNGLWAVDPTRVPEHDTTRPIWLTLGALSRQHSRVFIQKLGLAPEKHAKAHRVWEDSGLDHPMTARRAYENDRVYEWLLARSV
jgi:predicted peptidase